MASSASAIMNSNGVLSPPATEKGNSAMGSPPRVVLAGKTGRILCVADIRGDFHELNRLIREHEATAVIHTGDFGFITADSLERMGDKILRHLLQYSPLLAPSTRAQLLSIPASAGRAALISALNASSIHFPLSQFPLLLTGSITFPVPVFTVWGLIEDVRVLEKFRTGEYEVGNLSVIDEACTRVLDVGGLRLRLFGLGGAVAPHKMFDNGEGFATIAGGQGTMWTTALQIGELVDTAQRVYDSSETRLFISSAPISRNGLLSQLSAALKADLTISGGLHFRYPASFNEFSVHGDFEAYRQKLTQARETFVGVYQSVKDKVDSSLNENQLALLKKALAVAQNVPETDDGTWTNTWHWVLSDASCGHMLFSITDGRVSAETKSSGLNFSHRAQNAPAPPSAAVQNGTPVPRSNTATQPESHIKPPPSAPASSAVSQTPTPAAPLAPSVRPTPPAVRPPGVTATGPRPPANNNNPFGQPTARQNQNMGQNQAMGFRPMNVRGNLPVKPTESGQNGASSPAVRPPIQQQQQQQQVPRGPKNAFAPTVNTPPAPSGTAKPPTPAVSDTKKQVSTPTPKISTPTPAVEVEKKEENDSADVSGDTTSTKVEEKSNPVVNGNGGEKKARPEPRTEKLVDGSSTTGPSTVERPKKFSLFVRGFNTPIEEKELKTLFPGVEDTILLIKIPTFPGPEKKQQNFGYVEFANEELQKAALAVSTGKIDGKDVTVVLSDPPRGSFGGRGGRGNNGFRGAPRGAGRGMRGGGRGGRGGGDIGGGTPTVPTASQAAVAAKAHSGEKKD